VLPSKHSLDHMVGEVCAYVQGESLKAHTALLIEAYQLPGHQRREEILLTKKHLILAATMFAAGCAGIDQVGPEVPVPPAAQRVVGRAAADQMKDPVSAQFRNWHAFTSQNGLLICGEINAKNSFGGFVGFTHFVAHASPDGRLLTPTAIAAKPGGGPDIMIDQIWRQYYPGCY
jgi:hypothetical protein